MAIIKESRTLEVLNGSSTGSKFRHKYVHYMLKKRYIETKTAGKGSYRLEKRTAWQTYVDWEYSNQGEIDAHFLSNLIRKMNKLKE